ncbi:MAG: NHLP leader peptide family RiPP precursor [Chlamydiales bacterium]
MKKKQSSTQLQKKWAQVLAKAWADESFKKKLLKHPEQTLKEMGIEFPANTKVEIHEQKGKVVHFFIPPKPGGELSETELRNVAAGVGQPPPCAVNWVQGNTIACSSANCIIDPKG